MFAVVVGIECGDATAIAAARGVDLASYVPERQQIFILKVLNSLLTAGIVKAVV